MKNILLLNLFLLMSLFATAQDVIRKKNGQEISVKVVEITPDLIKYKRFDNLEGPLLLIRNIEVTEIKFENGTTEKIKPAPIPVKTENKPKIISFRKNALAINVLPVFFQSFNLFYDHHLTSKPDIGLSFGFGVYIHPEDFFTPDNTQIALTGAAKFYIAQSDFYLSPYLKYRHVSHTPNYYHYKPTIHWNQFGGGATFGARHVFKSGFLIDSYMGLGGYAIELSNLSLNDEYYFAPLDVDIRLGAAIGYAF